ncbi:MAG TPA: hypothetical protein VGJ66_07995 [Pyrinomonadaceae bacterium]|jgi:hypothetical protein
MKLDPSLAPAGTLIAGQPSVVFSAARPFDHRWPEKKGHPKAPEHFDTAYRATVVTSSGSKELLIGFSSSKRKGHRRRAVVFVDGRPTVRFKAADDFDHSGLMVSIIKTTIGTYLRPKDLIPVEYSSFRVEPYRNHVDEHCASKNMALVCARDDLQTMAEHALLSIIMNGVDTSLYGGWREY